MSFHRSRSEKRKKERRTWANHAQSSMLMSRSSRGILGPNSDSNMKSGLERTKALQGRLDEILVMELLENGDRTFLGLSVRSLYKYVLAAIVATPELKKTEKEKGNQDANSLTTVEEQDDAVPLDTQGASFSPPRNSGSGVTDNAKEGAVTYRERLGSYLHPRDMRRLFIPFSSSNEPEIIVRRHVMLLNFDPFRTIILRDRLLVIVPDGSDSLLYKLEQRVRGSAENFKFIMEESESDSTTEHLVTDLDTSNQDTNKNGKVSFKQIKASLGQKPHNTISAVRKTLLAKKKNIPEVSTTTLLTTSSQSTTSNTSAEDKFRGEWDELNGKEWVNVPFELQCVDAVLHVVGSILFDDTYELQEMTYKHIGGILDGTSGMHGDPILVIRHIKDSIDGLKSRVKSFMHSLNEVLDEDEDMALMNLSRLVTHPENFIRPVSEAELEKESDEPEVILEAHLQSALTLINGLSLIQGQITTASDLVDQKLDHIRNRILFANMIISVFTLCVAVASLVGSFFGMNLTNFLETDPHAFMIVTTSTVVGGIALVIFILATLYCTGTTPKSGLSL